MMRIAIGLLVALALSACAFISESQCRSGDWRGIGAGDGERGLGPERWSEFTKGTSRDVTIVHFLAILELMRSGSISATQEKLFSDIILESDAVSSAPKYG